MENKGLCNTCVNDKDCAFERKFPVYLCEEFDVIPLKGREKKEKAKKKR